MRFSTTLSQLGDNTGIEVPPDVFVALGAGQRAAVIVNVNGVEYRSILAAMAGKHLLPLSAVRRANRVSPVVTPSRSS
jgi:hypothetical protein